MTIGQTKTGRRTLPAIMGVLAVLFMAGHVMADFPGSAHDFSDHPLHVPSGPCVTCHTPHFSLDDGPLWNHMVTTQTYTLYNSNTFDGSTVQPNGVSKLCLSCHDGTIAVTAYGGHPLGEDEYYASSLPGENGLLSDDHPISFIYDTALAIQDGELRVPGASPSGLGGTIAADLLVNGTVECTTCHDVHNTLSVGNDFLLKIASADLCLTCHLK